MIKALIADDHVIVRKGLKQLFGMAGDIAVAGEASNGKEVMEALEFGQFDLVLLDLSMPGFSGTQLIERIRAHAPKLPILVFSMHNEVQTAKRALQAGAWGFVTKGSGKEILIAAIRCVAAGGRFIDPMVAERVMFEKPRPDESAPHERLSDRELQVMKRIAQGRAIKEIAEELCISDKTVSTHKTRLMKKMNIHKNAALVRYALDHDLVE